MKLVLNALTKYLFGVVITGLLLFLPAGTAKWINGWVFMVILFGPMMVVGIVLLVKNPDLLRKRLDAKENQSEQKVVFLISSLMFIAGFVLAGLNYRFGWLIMPFWISLAAAVIFLIAYGLYGEVLRENTYLSRTVRVEEHQTVIQTGLYGIVRHPMYSVTLLLFLSMPLVLGCLWSFFIFLFYPIILAKRIKNEEQVLKMELPGYVDYCKKVRYRLIPGIW